MYIILCMVMEAHLNTLIHTISQSRFGNSIKKFRHNCDLFTFTEKKIAPKMVSSLRFFQTLYFYFFNFPDESTKLH